MSRRTFLAATAGAAAAGLAGCTTARRATTQQAGVWVNDVHSQLNPTHIAAVEKPATRQALRDLIGNAHARRTSVSVCGGRHAGGGQQFRTDQTLIDLADLSRVLSFDEAKGTMEVEAGIRWPAVMRFVQEHPRRQEWAIHQKQGGADEVSLGGAIGSNIHSRHLNSRPFVQDVGAMSVITPDGSLVRCDREHDGDLFGKMMGGYGLFGVVYSLELRLEKRKLLMHHAEWGSIDNAIAQLEARRDAGAWHGSFEFAVDPASKDFCRNGLLSWYQPVETGTPAPLPDPAGEVAEFYGLAELAHADKSRAMDLYLQAALAKSGKIVRWSDDWMRSNYVPDYHRRAIDAARGAPGSEVLSEIHVPRAVLPDFLAEVATILRGDNAELIFSIVRLIERDDVSFLAWAKQPYACVIFNLHSQRDATSVERTRGTFQKLLDAAIRRNGSYYLTYHRFARPDQTDACYPQFRAFLQAKAKLDPRSTLTSDWHQHYAKQFGIT